ncbi:tripartite tricarboxylate transporter substrate binding protein [Bradyrhizobium prioriisuperbiae]|uniref:Bug family tripartite tricarboxylate transporter substrate binding protein n=1 Tax=Bradyrhizobium prioriisuperbiae TaxID=2854389 RepID=UPI0028EC284F|nr:tripartite tricarboxylate transporter substrate binding protein [Bradyrhizobium prioritasuperba]
MSFRHFALSLAALLALAGPARADDYPSRPVRIVVPFAAGGGTDLITRTLADIIASEWKAAIVIENKPGGGTTIAAQAVATAPADGYTLLATSNSFLVSPLLMPTKPYVWERDFTGVTLFAVSPHILVVHPSVPAKTLPEFIAWAKAQDGKAAFASFGSGSSNHLGFEVLKRKLGIELVHVPYKGSAPAMNDLVAGHVQAMLGDLQNVSEQLKGGTLRPIAVANESRIPSMPDLPTLNELGVTGFTSKSWFGALVRKGTSPEIVAKWSAAFADALKRPAVKERLASLGVDLVGSSPEQMQAFLASEAAKAEDAVKLSGAKME